MPAVSWEASNRQEELLESTKSNEYHFTRIAHVERNDYIRNQNEASLNMNGRNARKKSTKCKKSMEN